MQRRSDVSPNVWGASVRSLKGHGGWLLALIWTAVVFASLAWNVHLVRAGIRTQAFGQATAAIDKDMVYRHLVAEWGGVYVREGRGVEANPFLAAVPQRDVVTTGGIRLTLINSSYFVRLVHDEEKRSAGAGARGRVVSERPLRPQNRPDAWEQAALRAFARGKQEVSGVVEAGGKRYLRLMRPRLTEAGCLACHGAQGFKVGEVLGGLSVMVPFAPLEAQAERLYRPLVGGHLAIWLLGLLGMAIGFRRLRHQRRRLYLAAYQDPLTGLPNRKLLYDRAHQAMAQAQAHGHHGALLLLDLDRFKNINDALGHAVGDQLLCEAARRLRRDCRAEDMAARLGGDEFVALLPELADDPEHAAVEAERMAQRWRRILAEPYFVGSYELHVSASIGVVLFPEQGRSVDEVLKRADAAMYQAKARGRNAIQFFLPSLQAAADERLELEKDLHHALAQDQLSFDFQPQVDDASRIVGLEALLRWHHPQRGSVPPNEFVPVAEESGLILAIGAAMLRKAAAQVRRWLDAGIDLGPGFVSINVSARQFHADDFVDQVRGAVDEFDLPPSVLKLELTESVLVDDSANTVAKMHALQALGIQFSIDDFGTGYSSLSYLKRLPLNALKIDRSFVRDIDSDPNDMAIVETVIGMAKTLGLDVVAEGVETAMQVAFLKRRGCRIFQGFYFSHPLPADEITPILANQWQELRVQEQ